MTTHTDLTIEAIRDRRRGRYIVPMTGHWGDWRDADAVRYHGICVGNAADEKILKAMQRALGEYGDHWTCTLRGEERDKSDYMAAFYAAKELSYHADNGDFL